MTAYIYSMPSAIAGAITRPDTAVVEPATVSVTNTPTQYGVAVKATSTGIQAIIAGAVDADVYGILVRPFPSQGSLTAGSVSDVLRFGYIGVLTYGSATPVKGGIVYVRTVVGAGSEPVGSFSTVADAGNTFILTGASFTGGKDSNGLAEVFFSAN